MVDVSIFADTRFHSRLDPVLDLRSRRMHNVRSCRGSGPVVPVEVPSANAMGNRSVRRVSGGFYFSTRSFLQLSLLVVLLSLVPASSALSAAGWTVQTGSPLLIPRSHPPATILGDGRILVVGGSQLESSGFPLRSAEVFDPDTGRWSATADMTHTRPDHPAGAFPNGKGFVAGGGLKPH